MKKKYFFSLALILFLAGLTILSGCQADSALKLDTETASEESIASRSLPTRTLTLTPTQSGRVFSIDPDDGTEDASYFASQAWTWSGKPGIVRSLMRFNLYSIPKGAIITGARLYLYHHPEIKHSPLTRSNASYLERVTDLWSAWKTTWNNQPATTRMNRVYLPKSQSSTENYVLDVKNLVNDMLKYGNFGMMLKLATESHYASLYFASGNYSNSAYHPRLVISYTLDTSGWQNIPWVLERAYLPGGVSFLPSYKDQYKLTFHSDGSYSGDDFCNSCGGEYSVSGSAMKVLSYFSTKKGCIGHQIKNFAAYLLKVTNYYINGNTLTLPFNDPTGSGVFIFKKG